MQLAHNVWDPDRKRSQVRVTHSFGPADTLDVAGLRRLASSIGRFLDRGESGPAAEPPPDGLRLLASRPMGAGWLLDGLRCWFDTTSSYFETPDDDAFGRYGHSTDHRGDRPQTVIGLAVTKQGIPVRVWSWPGNAADSAVITTVHADLGRWGLHRVLWVGDRGFTSAENRQLLQTGGGHVLFAELLRGGRDNAAALARPGRYRVVADNLHVKQVGVGDGVTRRRFIVVRNPDEATRDAAPRERHLTRITAELEAIQRK